MVLRKGHPVADLGNREGSVLLQHGEDFAVNGIEPAVGLGGGVNSKVGHARRTFFHI